MCKAHYRFGTGWATNVCGVWRFLYGILFAICSWFSSSLTVHHLSSLRNRHFLNGVCRLRVAFRGAALWCALTRWWWWWACVYSPATGCRAAAAALYHTRIKLLYTNILQQQRSRFAFSGGNTRQHMTALACLRSFIPPGASL